MPQDCTFSTAFSAATFAAYGVLLRDPLNPQDPAEAHPSVLPLSSVIVTIVLLRPAWMHTRACGTERLDLRLGAGAAAASVSAAGVFTSSGMVYVFVRVTRPESPVFFFPRRVRALRRKEEDRTL